MNGGLFGLTAWEKKLLEPLPPGVSVTLLVNRLYQLENLRGNTFIKMEAPGATILDIVRCQADVTLIGLAMEATILRTRAACIRAKAARHLKEK